MQFIKFKTMFIEHLYSGWHRRVRELVMQRWLENHRLWVQIPAFPTLAPLVPSCVTLGKQPNLWEPNCISC